MRMIIEIGEHSVFAPAMAGVVLDAGANKGLFSKGVASRFPVDVISVEANPALADRLRREGHVVAECALGDRDGEISFNIGENDETSSLIAPSSADALLVVRDRVTVRMRTLEDILGEFGHQRVSCVKLDIEGGEISVLRQLAARAAGISPQWTIEFHDHPQFALSTSGEVDEVLGLMQASGFSALIRDWPHRTNVLLVHRKALDIGPLRWVIIRLRYQFFAVAWRKLRGIGS